MKKIILILAVILTVITSGINTIKQKENNNFKQNVIVNSQEVLRCSADIVKDVNIICD